jgi:hypothetical protein
MSLLPQRKKSAEEIAQLRESLGIAGPPPVASEPSSPETRVDWMISTTHEAAVEHSPQAVHPEPEPEPHAHPHPSGDHSLKRLERLPVMPEPVVATSQRPLAPGPPTPESEPPRAPKRVRSLRKSEQAPIAPPKPVTSQAQSLAPFHRHSDEELAEIRRRAALAQLSAPPPPNLTSAHPVVITSGYLASAGAAAGIWFYQIPIATAAACLGVSTLIAAFIYFRSPYSRHHAGFITIFVLFVAAFGALQYFPQLTFKHGP